MPSIIEPRDDYIKITGDSLTIDSSLIPKPSAGIQVHFKFAFAEVDGVRCLIGLGTIWDNWDAEPRPADIDDYDDLEDLTNLKDKNGEGFNPEHFRGLKGNQTISLDLGYLARALLDRDFEDLEETLLGETLKAFLASYAVTAEIDNIGDGIAVDVEFSRFGATVFSFRFEADEDAAEKLFTFNKVDCLAS